MSGLAVREISTGLWLWRVADPKSSGATVASLYFEGPSHVVLVDPVLPADGTPHRERFLTHLERDLDRVDRPLAIVLTAADRTCDEAFFEERYGAEVDGESVDGGSQILPGLGAILVGDGRPFDRIVTIPAHRAAFCGEIIWGDGRSLSVGPAFARQPLAEDGRRLVEQLRAFAPDVVLVAREESVLTGCAEAIDSLLELGGGRFGGDDRQ